MILVYLLIGFLFLKSGKVLYWRIYYHFQKPPWYITEMINISKRRQELNERIKKQGEKIMYDYWEEGQIEAQILHLKYKFFNLDEKTGLEIK